MSATRPPAHAWDSWALPLEPRALGDEETQARGLQEWRRQREKGLFHRESVIAPSASKVTGQSMGEGRRRGGQRRESRTEQDTGGLLFPGLTTSSSRVPTLPPGKPHDSARSPEPPEAPLSRGREMPTSTPPHTAQLVTRASGSLPSQQ